MANHKPGHTLTASHPAHTFFQAFPLSPRLQELRRLVPGRAVGSRHLLGVQSLDTSIERIKEVAGDIQVLGKSQGIRHISTREALLLLCLEGVIRRDIIEVRLDRNSQGDVGVVEEGEPVRRISTAIQIKGVIVRTY